MIDKPRPIVVNDVGALVVKASIETGGLSLYDLKGHRVGTEIPGIVQRKGKVYNPSDVTGMNRNKGIGIELGVAYAGTVQSAHEV